MPIIISGGGGGSGKVSGVTVSGTAAAGQVPVASSPSAGAWAYPPGYQWDFKAATASVNIVGTSEASPTTLITGNGATFDGQPVLVTFYAPAIATSAGAASDQVQISVWEGVAQLGRMAISRSVVATAGSQVVQAFVGHYIFTPTAAAHTYFITGNAPDTTGTPQMLAGAAGTATLVNAFMRITKI